jgi:hypothetical protein
MSLIKSLKVEGLSFADLQLVVTFGYCSPCIQDDCNIFLRSHKAANRVMQGVSKFIEKKMKLVVNLEKSKVAKADFVKFLGGLHGRAIHAGSIVVSSVAMKRAMELLAMQPGRLKN